MLAVLLKVLPNADQTMALSMDQFDKIETLGRGAHGEPCSFGKWTLLCFKGKDPCSYAMCWCSGAGVAILVKPKSAGSSAALRVVGHSGWFHILYVSI